MRLTPLLSFIPLVLSTPIQRATPLYPHDIQGLGFLSSSSGSKIANLQGILTAITSTGYYLQTPTSKFDSDTKTSEGLFVFGSLPSSLNATVNDLISISNATVSEYSQYSTNLKTTELTKAIGVKIVTKGNSAEGKPLLLSVSGVHPPTEFIAVQDPFALPSETFNVENQRATSLNLTFGLDFWESLESMLVTLPTPRALFRPNRFGEVYVVSRSLPSTSGNSRGGMTYAAQERNGETYWDSNPEFILVGEPLNGDKNPSTILMGDELSDITGIVSYDFGAPVLLPLKGIHVVRKAVGDIAATNLTGDGSCGNLLVGTYNVENLPANDTSRISKLGAHVDNYLNNPSVMVLNEVQDNDGPTDDGVVSASSTLSEFTSAIKNAPYDYIDIDPSNDQDGGQPGGNIRTSIIYRTDHLSLVSNVPAGGDMEAVNVTTDANGKATLNLNPGRIEPTNSAWNSSRKPLVAQFTLKNGGETLFVVGSHFTAKLGSSELAGPEQPPSNGGVDQRIKQAQVVRNFVDQLLKVQSDAKVVLLGDFNEFSAVEPLDTLTSPVSQGSSPVLSEIQVEVREERYSYVFEGNSQQIDHFFTTPALAASAKTEIVHVNNWISESDAASDHDPLVGSLNIC